MLQRRTPRERQSQRLGAETVDPSLLQVDGGHALGRLHVRRLLIWLRHHQTAAEHARTRRVRCLGRLAALLSLPSCGMTAGAGLHRMGGTTPSTTVHWRAVWGRVGVAVDRLPTERRRLLRPCGAMQHAPMAVLRLSRAVHASLVQLSRALTDGEVHPGREALHAQHPQQTALQCGTVVADGEAQPVRHAARTQLVQLADIPPPLHSPGCPIGMRTLLHADPSGHSRPPSEEGAGRQPAANRLPEAGARVLLLHDSSPAEEVESDQRRAGAHDGDRHGRKQP